MYILHISYVITSKPFCRTLLCDRWQTHCGVCVAQRFPSSFGNVHKKSCHYPEGREQYSHRWPENSCCPTMNLTFAETCRLHWIPIQETLNRPQKRRNWGKFFTRYQQSNWHCEPFSSIKRKLGSKDSWKSLMTRSGLQTKRHMYVSPACTHRRQQSL